MLKIEDLEVGMKVFVNATGCGLLTILKLGVAGFFTQEKGYFNYKCSWIDWKKTAELNGFKKKEQSQQYTFDDLIDVAVQACKDGVATVKIDTKLHTVFVEELKTAYGMGHIDLGIKEIKSLYKETFVIGSEEDLKRVKLNPKITLNNGEVIPFSFKSAVKDHLIFYDQPCGHNMIHFVFLKGATVEQERGRDDRS